MSRSLSLVFGVAGATLLLSACGPTASPSSAPAAPAASAPTQKVGNTTKSGKIVKLGASYYIQEEGKQPAQIDSYQIDLSQYVDKTVTITGQYSGDTLFVGKVQ